MGDEITNGSYRPILSFDTSALPAGTIVSAELYLRRIGGVGDVSALTLPSIEIKNGFFGTSSALESAD
jgi:hypothetical protein